MLEALDARDAVTVGASHDCHFVFGGATDMARVEVDWGSRTASLFVVFREPWRWLWCVLNFQLCHVCIITVSLINRFDFVLIRNVLFIPEGITLLADVMCPPVIVVKVACALATAFTLVLTLLIDDGLHS